MTFCGKFCLEAGHVSSHNGPLFCVGIRARGHTICGITALEPPSLDCLNIIPLQIGSGFPAGSCSSTHTALQNPSIHTKGIPASGMRSICFNLHTLKSGPVSLSTLRMRSTPRVTTKKWRVEVVRTTPLLSPTMMVS
jgi:hypothetical protein